VNDTEDLWISCAEALREQVSDAIWQAYLSGITPLSIKEHEILLGVPNKLIRDRVESRFLGLIQDTVTSTLGRDLIVHLEIMAPLDDQPAVPVGAGAPSSPDIPSPPARVGGPGRSELGASPVLDPRYTFETFVIASSNRFAHAAAQSVAESPPVPTTHCSSTGMRGWARPICSTPSGTTSSRTSPAATSVMSPPRPI
jgi:chromosomal replication initiator protein